MSHSDMASRIFVGVLFLFLASYLAVHIPYALGYMRRKNGLATVQNFTTGVINRGKQCIVPARFVGYAFKIQEHRFGGLLERDGSLAEVGISAMSYLAWLEQR